MAEEYMVAECGAVIPMSGNLVWFDYLNHRYLRISARGLELVGLFQRWSSIDELASDESREAISSLLRAQVLKVKGGSRDLREQRIIAEWGEELVAARIFQFATRTAMTQEFVPLPEAVAIVERQNVERPRPSLGREISGPAYRLNCDSVAEVFESASLVSSLLERKSVRSFDSKMEVSYAKLSSILQLGAGAREVQQKGVLDDYFKRTSASGGSLQPVDVYCYARRVSGVVPGWYYLDSIKCELKRVADASPDATICAAAGDQPFFGTSAIVLVFAADVRREFWKYRSARAYRVIMADFGHIAQTFALLSVAAGMASVLSCALRDEMIEGILGLDSTCQIPLGAMAIGFQNGDPGTGATRPPAVAEL